MRTVGPPSHSFLASFGARRFPKGNEGKRVSSGYNRRRRLATGRSGKQQAERTAVRTAPIVCPEESPLVRPQAHTPCPGWSLTRRLRRGRWGCRPDGGSTFFRSERKYQRKHAARRLQRRPTSLCAVGFGLREPNGWMPRINSGHPIPALRPEQSDHVPWADCPQGLSSTSARYAHPPGKRLLLPILPAGLAMSRAMKLDSLRTGAERARARLFPPSKWAGLFPSAAYRRSSPPQLAVGRLTPCGVG